MKQRTLRVGMLFGFLSAVVAMPSEADLIFERMGGGTGNNVLFSCGGDPICEAENSDDDNVLIGRIQNSGFFTEFTADVDIMPGAAGQATIVRVDEDDTWLSLDMTWLNFDSTDLVILRVKPTVDGTTIVLTACDLVHCGWTSFPDFEGVSAPQGDFFRVRAVDGQRIVSLGVSALDGALSEVEQVRLGNLFLNGDDVTPIPEPGLLTLLGVGLVAAGHRARRRRV